MANQEPSSTSAHAKMPLGCAGVRDYTPKGLLDFLREIVYPPWPLLLGDGVPQ